MHYQSDLEAMSLDELKAMAKEFKAEITDDKTQLIYNIIDAESLLSSQTVSETKKPAKRGRKSKAEKEALEKAKAEAEKAASEAKTKKNKPKEDAKPEEKAKEDGEVKT